MSVLLVCLALVCLAWWGVAAATLRTARQTRRLVELPLPPPEAALPGLTVICAARDEEAGLEEALRARLASDYPALRVILVDDRSRDRTGEIARALAAEDERLQVIHNRELPPGWLGKLNALRLGAEAAGTDYLLFSDADVVVSPETLRRAVAACEREGWEVLSALPTFEARSWVLGTIYACFLQLLYPGMRPRAVEDPAHPHGVGVGAFTLVRRAALERSPGLKALRMEVADDLMLGRLLKAAGAKSTIVDGAGAVRVAIYRSAAAFVRGAEKNAWAVSANFSLAQGLAATLGALALWFSPLLLTGIALATGRPALAALGGATQAAVTLLSMGLLHRNAQPPWPGLLWPVGAAIFVWASLQGTILGWRRGGLQWRDTFHPTADFLAYQRERDARGWFDRSA
ncbi:MAG: glycosyltransferase family 2 protein [Deltaproteobacteria bacterium]|nr:glycosyltransferase family 2 protein [Deltaproteobacteria bacterium]